MIREEGQRSYRSKLRRSQHGPLLAPAAAHKPIELAKAKAEPRAPKVEKVSAFTQRIDALGEATEALRRRLEKAQQAAPAKTRAAKAKAATPRKRPASKPSAAERAPGEAAPARPTRTRARKAAGPKPHRQRRKVRRRRDPSRSPMADPGGDIAPPSALLLALEPYHILRGIRPRGSETQMRVRRHTALPYPRASPSVRHAR